MEGTPLLDVMRGLILEPEAQAEFAADPSGYMQRFGYDDVPEDDMREAVGLVADTLPPDVAHAVTTAADAPADDDAFGDGSVGILGRISTAEVTESVVPELDDLPPGDASVADEHDATAFGDVTRDFDDEAGDDDASAGGDDHTAGDDPADTDADSDVTDAAGGDDLGFGDSSFGDDPAAFDATPAPDDAGAFGEGSHADAFATDSAESYEAAAGESFDDGGFDQFDTAADDPSGYTSDDPTLDDALDGGLDGGLGAIDDMDGGDVGSDVDAGMDLDGAPDGGAFDDDVGSF
jgi:hypothetical protein